MVIWVTQGHRRCQLSNKRIYDFPFAFHRDYAPIGPILDCFRDIANCLLKVAIFHAPRVFGVPVEGDPIGISPRSLVKEN